ncbi:MAG: UDP-glucose 4-epimerase GalE [Candidatus Krumholzibacteria bacterium]|nr:UDP-glucose 4-epimerase GalE [Candidatus Krumholzibacteria bacterium]
MRLCVTGGAGYIGSVVAQTLVDEGHDVTIVDNLSTGHEAAIPKGCRFVKGDIRDERTVIKALSQGIEAVLHFAALSVVADSVERPLDYFDNNAGGTLRILQAMKQCDIDRIIFSSSAAVYGDPDRLPIEETAPCCPTSPYGHSKLFVERMLRSCQAWGLRFASLRYFNAGGSTGVHGEHHDPESHLIPIVLDVALGKRKQFSIFGGDYDTEDGTCVRDYIHVHDLAVAHVLAIDAVSKGFSGILNLGSDKAFTVLEVVKTVQRVTGREVAHHIGPRRPGDPQALLASSKLAQRTLGWVKTCSSLEEIVRSAYKWRLEHPRGYSR